MKKIQVVCVSIFLALLSGCANNNVWTKAGAGQSEFSQARYNCLQQSQQGASSAYVNRYGGVAVASSGAVTNDGLFSACMNAAGWSLQNKDTLPQNQAQAASGKARFDQNIETMKAACISPEFQLYYSKTSCTANAVTMSQMSDKTKITAAEKPVLEAATIKIDTLTRDNNSIIRTAGSEKDKAFANYLETIYMPLLDKNRFNLYDGKITWGDFNRRRKELGDAYLAERKRIYGN